MRARRSFCKGFGKSPHTSDSRFADGGEFGFGAEIGISTDKLHAHGPMGLRELTSYQYRVRGDGQVKV